MLFKVFFCMFLLITFSSSYFVHFENKSKYFKHETTNYTSQNTGVKLTPFIQSGQLELAKNMSSVPSLVGNVTSYAGFLTVDQVCDSNMFFWFFPAQNNPETSPIIIWLQGGPGVPSTFGLFTENGPYSLIGKDQLELREHPWTKIASVLYIDNPVATGYSYTNVDLEGCISNNQTHVGKNLYAALTQFYELFTELRPNPLFIIGESYAGKYVPAFGYTIHMNNPSADVKINLKGLAIGNGLSDPINQLRYGDFLYQIGFIDENQREKYWEMEQHVRDLILTGDHGAATSALWSVITHIHSTIRNMNIYNFMQDKTPSLHDVPNFMQTKEVREALKVGDSKWFDSQYAQTGLEDDWTKSVKEWIEELLDNYPVLLYGGHLDIIVAYSVSSEFKQNLNWSAAEEYRKAEKKIWQFGDKTAGYVKKGGNLFDVVVRNAGHMVPTDQPEFALDLIEKFINNKL